MKLRFYIIFLLLLCFSSLSFGGVIIVTSGSNSGTGTLRDAITSASSGDSIIINLKGAIGLSSPIIIDSKSNIAIIGPYPKHISFIAEGALVPNIFEIRNSTGIVIKGIGFKHFFDPTFTVRAAQIDNGSSVIFEECLFEGCQPENAKGGAVSVTGGSKVRIANCSFFDNKSEYGGAIYFDDSNNEAEFFNNTFFGNRADSSGGAIMIDSVQSVIESYIFYNNTFRGNVANTLVTTSGHAIWLNIADDGNTFSGTRAVVFINNVFAENFNTSFLDQSQVYANNGFASLNFNIWASHNYYHFASGAEPILDNFTASPGNDLTGEYLVADVHLRDLPVIDGYGLKYFPINNSGSPLINSGDNTPSYIIFIGSINFSVILPLEDQRRAPRILLGTADIGAVEYTPYRMVGSPNPNEWRSMIDDINSSSTPGDVHYVEFDLDNPTDGIRVHQNTFAIDRKIYIDGFSQDGSSIPGSNNVSIFTTSSDTLTSARNLVTLYNQNNTNNGIELNNAPNSTIAGISLIDFDEYGISIGNSANNSTVFGNVIGVKSNVDNGLTSSPDDGNELGGIYVNAESVIIGGHFHHQRNVIVDNGFNESDGAVDYEGANIRMSTAANHTNIIGNVIGLHPNGKDSIPLEILNINLKAPNGIYADGGSNINIGDDYLFGQNTISYHPGNGIFHKNTSSANIVIDNNHIGTSFSGNDSLGNRNGIYLSAIDDDYFIGGSSGNIISANDSAGIYINSGEGILIQGNIIGGAANLTATNFGNETGIYIEGISGESTEPNIIGGDDYENNSERNIIVNNTKAGVRLSGEDVRFTKIKGNLIGVTSDIAIVAFPNTIGVQLDSGTQDNFIGYEEGSGNFGQINIISGNTESGVFLYGKEVKNNRVASNLIGGTFPTTVGDPLNDVGNKNGIETYNVDGNIFGNENDTDLQLIIVGNEVGIRTDTTSDLNIVNSRIGIDANNNEIGNKVGILTIDSDAITIGGAANKSNVISGNDTIGIYFLNSTRGVVSGNLIGTDDSGVNPITNNIGIRIKGGELHEIGEAETNVISGNYYGLVMDSTITNTIRNNYFGLSADGTASVSNSYYGIVARDLYMTNLFGLNNAGAGMKNYFATDSVDLGITSSKEQKIRNNVMGYGIDGTTVINGDNKGIGIRLQNSKYMQIGENSAFGNNTIANKISGLALLTVDSSQIENNHFGTDLSGTGISNPNNQRYGIINRSNVASVNKIGPNNVFGGNQVGLILASGSNNNSVFGNYFGLDTALNNSANFENDTAIYFNGTVNNIVGGAGDSTNQMINYTHGIVLRNGADTNRITNNYIGIASNGTVGANLGSGVVIDNSNMNQLGSVDILDRNIIARNNARGIDIVNGSSGNSLLRNAIFENNSLGIDFEADNIPDSLGVAGIQDGIQTPILNSVFPCGGSSEIRIELVLNGLTPGEDYYLDLYENGSVLDPTGFGEGENSIYFLTHTSVNASDTILIDLTAAGLTGLSVGDNLTAILTSVSNASSSEFGRNIIIDPTPSDPIISGTQEVCRNGKGGSIEVNNSANSGLDYDVLLSPSNMMMEAIGIDNFLEDSLAPNNYTVTINYSNGCITSNAQVLNTGPSYEADISVLSDTCTTGTGQVTLDTMLYQIGGVINSFSYSINGGSNFFTSGLFSGQTSGATIDPAMLIEVTVGGITDNCPSTNNMSENVGNYILTTELNFGYDRFCVGDGGTVSPLPSFTSGSYSMVNNTGSGVINTSTGAISGESDNANYDVTYSYGTGCSNTVSGVIADDVPDSNFVFDDFCANSQTAVEPLSIATSGGAFTMVAPSADESIASTDGIITTSSPSGELTPGNYVITYNTQDPQCPGTFTDNIEILAKPTDISVTTAGNVFDNNALDIDSISFCPNLGANNITSPFTNTVWTLPSGGTVTTAVFTANLSADDSLYILRYFHTIAYPTVTCSSDTDSSLIQIYKEAVQPTIINGDIAYCENESVIALENTETNNAVNWYLDSPVNQTVINNDVYSLNGPYNNTIQKVYAQDSTGFMCYSELDSTEIIFLKQPENIVLRYQSSLLNPNDTAVICPNLVDTIFAINSDSINTLWQTVGSSTIDTTNQYVSKFLPSSFQLVSVVKDSVYLPNLTIDPTGEKTCYSTRDTIGIRILNLPAKPLISNGDTTYCNGEPIAVLYDSDSLLTNHVLWYEVSTSDMTFLSNPLDSHVISNVNYNNTSFDIFARDSTGLKCYSEFDKVSVIFHETPDLPILRINDLTGPIISSNDSINLCPNIGELDSIFASTGSYLNTNTIWEIIGGNTDTVGQYNITTSPETIDGLVYSRDTLYSSGRYCNSLTDTIYLNVLSSPIPTNFPNTAYCDNEDIANLVTNDGKNLVWTSNNSATVVTNTPHAYSPTAPAMYNYQVDTITVYDSTGVTSLNNECFSEIDTVLIAYHARPDTSAVTLASTGALTLDTTLVCPRFSESFNVNTAASESSWSLSQTGAYTTGSTFDIGNFTENTNTVVYNYRDTTVTLTILKTCHSDTNARVVQTFFTPVQPTITTDTSYCEGEFVAPSSVQNTGDVHTIIWGDDIAGNPRVIQSTGPFDYTTVNTDYNDILAEVYAIDSTGAGCYSDTGFVSISYHASPLVPSIVFNTDPTFLNSGDTVRVCPNPTNQDSLVANTSQSLTFFESVIGDENDKSYNIPLAVTNTIAKVNFRVGEEFNLVDNITCFSVYDSVYVEIYALPETPVILSGGPNIIDTVNYCEINAVDNLSLQNPSNFVNWHQPFVSESDSTLTNQYDITPPGTYTGQIQTVVAIDSTGENCFSETDTIRISFNQTPNAPVITPVDTFFCQNEVLDTLFSDVVSNWFIGGTSGTPDQSETANFALNSYTFLTVSDTVQYFAQTMSLKGCLSPFSQAEVRYHPTPTIPTGTVQPPGPLSYCPDVLRDTLVADRILTWYLSNDMTSGEVFNDSLDLNDYVSLVAEKLDTVKYFYTDIVTNCHSDTSSIPIEIFGVPLAPIVSTLDTAYCEGDLTFELLTTNISTGNSSASIWYNNTGAALLNGNGVSYDLANMAPLNVEDTIIYFTYVDNNDCQADYDSIIIYTFETPVTPIITDLADTSFCIGETLSTLFEDSGDMTNWYFINNGVDELKSENTDSYMPLDSGTYFVQTIINDCPSLTDSIGIIINQLPEAPIIAPMQLNYCSDESIDTIRIEDGSNGFWYAGDDLTTPISSNDDFYWTSSTIVDSIKYYVNVFNPLTECSSVFDSITLMQYISLGNISTDFVEICAGYSETIEATGGKSYLWSTGDTTSSINVTPLINTWYNVEITDINNCLKLDSIEVNLKLPASCLETVYTAFSPNGDGVNEVWEITGIENYTNVSVYIFNRWGDQIVKIDDYNNSVNVWDGTNQLTGQMSISGTYYYIIEENGNKVKDGWVQLMR